MKAATDIAFFLLGLLVLSVWVPIMVWVLVQIGVYAFYFAKRRCLKHQERFDGIEEKQG